MTDPAPAALGMRAHSGWTAMVAIAGPANRPCLLDRRHVGLVEAGNQQTAQPYHAAAKLELRKAEEFVRAYEERARAMAMESVSERIADLGRRGYRVVACGVLLSSGRPTGDLAQTLASHTLIHTAEGHLFRNSLVWAGQHCGLTVTEVKERDLLTTAESKLGIPVGVFQAQLAEMGRVAGPPWRQDEKCSALVAWVALAAAHGVTA